MEYPDHLQRRMAQPRTADTAPLLTDAQAARLLRDGQMTAFERRDLARYIKDLQMSVDHYRSLEGRCTECERLAAEAHGYGL